MYNEKGNMILKSFRKFMIKKLLLDIVYSLSLLNTCISKCKDFKQQKNNVQRHSNQIQNL